MFTRPSHYIAVSDFSIDNEVSIAKQRIFQIHRQVWLLFERLRHGGPAAPGRYGAQKPQVLTPLRKPDDYSPSCLPSSAACSRWKLRMLSASLRTAAQKSGKSAMTALKFSRVYGSGFPPLSVTPSQPTTTVSK